MLKELDSNAFKITKIIQEFIAYEGKADNKNKYMGDEYYKFLAPFYDALAKKVDSLKKIESYRDTLSDKDAIEVDKRGTLFKKVSMEHSTSYFAEIVGHIMMIMDINFLESDKLFDKIKNLFIDLILNFNKIPLDTLKGVVLDEYYNDLIYSMVGYSDAEQSHNTCLPTHYQK